MSLLADLEEAARLRPRDGAARKDGVADRLDRMADALDVQARKSRRKAAERFAHPRHAQRADTATALAILYRDMAAELRREEAAR